MAGTVVTGYAPTPVTIGPTVSVDLAGTVVSAFAPEISTGALISVPLAGTVVIGYAPDVSTNILVRPDLASTVVAGYAPTVFSGASVDVDLAATVVTANGPDLGVFPIGVACAGTVCEAYEPEISLVEPRRIAVGGGFEEEGESWQDFINKKNRLKTVERELQKKVSEVKRIEQKLHKLEDRTLPTGILNDPNRYLQLAMRQEAIKVEIWNLERELNDLKIAMQIGVQKQIDEQDDEDVLLLL